MLRDGRANVAILHWPLGDLGAFDIDAPVVKEPVLNLPSGHLRSTRTSIEVAEARSISDLPLPRWPTGLPGDC